MKKYLEQRVEELELEVKMLKAKFKLEETKSKSTSQYINNYPPYVPFKVIKKINTKCKENTRSSNCCSSYAYDYMHTTPSVNLMAEPDLETAFASPFDKTKPEKTSLDTITVSIPTHSDADIEDVFSNQQYSYLEEFPPYPDITGSWDTNPNDVVDEYGFKMNYNSKPNNTEEVKSNFDKHDKDFLNWLQWKNRNK